MKDYIPIAREIYASLVRRYGLQLAALNNGEFFLVGHGFSLWISIDPRDGADTWYVSVDNSGNILTYTLMYLMDERFTQQDSTIYGNPTTLDEHVIADMRTDAAWLSSKCHDLLSGDKKWLHGYKGKGHTSRHVTRFLAPYFKKQGYPVII
jgi:hypothetical protein